MAFEIINPDGMADIILISEHASNHIPDEFNNLGLSEEQLELHIAWDIGIGQITRNLSKMLNAPAIVARFSRLLIDANRRLEQDGLIPEETDGHVISANQNLSKDAIKQRIDQFYTPFHDQANILVQEKIGNIHAPLILNMHSFTPVMNAEERPWHIGLLWDKDDRLAMAVKQILDAKGFCVGDNKPYTGRELNHTMKTHGTRHGFPHVNIEVRQDEINHLAGIDKWSKILCDTISEIRAFPEMSHIKHY